MDAREAQHRHELRQQTNVVRDNPFGLPRETAGEIVAALNQDLAAMITLYQQYHKHHWIVEGAQFLELHLLLEEHYNQLHDQFDAVAERIVALGGLPVSGPAEIQQHAYIRHEDPGMFDLREMLEHDLDAEGTLASHLRQHIELASRLGDYGTEALLKAILEATEKRAAFLEKHLQEESLTRGIPTR